VLFSEVSLAVSYRRRPGVNAVAVVSTPASVLVVAHTVLAAVVGTTEKSAIAVELASG
jgi:hypothetical protein